MGTMRCQLLLLILLDIKSHPYMRGKEMERVDLQYLKSKQLLGNNKFLDIQNTLKNFLDHRELLQLLKYHGKFRLDNGIFLDYQYLMGNRNHLDILFQSTFPY